VTPAVHGERARRTAVDRRRASRDLCPPRTMRPEDDIQPPAELDRAPWPTEEPWLDEPAEAAGGVRAAQIHHTPEGVTLDDVLSGAWEALGRHESAACPVCGGAMRPRYGSGPVPAGGRCTSCSTVLA
jgi:hypothetical protein